MLIHTDVTCLYCAHVSWRVELEHSARWQTARVLWPEPGASLPTHPRCARCGGPVYLDEDYRVVRDQQSRRRDQKWSARGVSRGAAAETVAPGSPESRWHGQAVA